MPLPGGPWPEPVKQAAVLKLATPRQRDLWLPGRGLSARRKFDDDYRDFVRLVGANISAALAGVRALEDERQRAETLAELDRAKTAFFSNVSHEFRTPLTLMLGSARGPARAVRTALPPDDRALLDGCAAQRPALLKLVNTLLDFARIEAGRAQATYRPTDLARADRRPGEQLPFGVRARRHRASSVDCAPLADAGLRRSRDVGEDRSQPAVERLQVHASRARSRCACAMPAAPSS